MSNKTELFESGAKLLVSFCKKNNLIIPDIKIRPTETWPYEVCAYYRPVRIEICIEKCAAIGTAGRSWSYPGYTVDRTPYGVLQHELGHYVDCLESKQLPSNYKGYIGDYSRQLYLETKEEAITSYCPNYGEWFAEIFRVFVTNPDLLSILRPKVYENLSKLYTPVIEKTWDKVLEDAPERTKIACMNKINQARGLK